MTKILTVATEVQKAVFTQVLLPEIVSGFWKNVRPVDQADSWKGVQVEVGLELGARGFDVPRNYNFVNLAFFPGAEEKLLAAGRSVNPELTSKQLKKQLITLNQILGGRLTELGGKVRKLNRGHKPTATTNDDSITRVRRVPVSTAVEA